MLNSLRNNNAIGHIANFCMTIVWAALAFQFRSHGPIWDDLLILGNPGFSGLGVFDGALYSYPLPLTPFFRPLSVGFFAIANATSDPLLYSQAIGIGLLCAYSILSFSLIQKLLLKTTRCSNTLPFQALFVLVNGLALFHPSTLMAALWTAARGDTLAMLCCMAYLLAVLNFQEKLPGQADNHLARFILLSIFLTLCAGLAKDLGILFGLSAATIVSIYNRIGFKNYAMTIGLPIGLATFAVFALRYILLGAGQYKAANISFDYFLYLGFSENCWFALESFLQYALSFLAPFAYSKTYHISSFPPHGSDIAVLFLLLVSFAFCIRKAFFGKRSAEAMLFLIFFAWVSFLSALMSLMHLTWDNTAIERYALCAFPFAAAAGASLSIRLYRILANKMKLAAILLALPLFTFCGTFASFISESSVWRYDNLAYWIMLQHQSPNSPYIFSNWTMALMNEFQNPDTFFRHVSKNNNALPIPKNSDLARAFRIFLDQSEDLASAISDSQYSKGHQNYVDLSENSFSFFYPLLLILDNQNEKAAQWVKDKHKAGARWPAMYLAAALLAKNDGDCKHAVQFLDFNAELSALRIHDQKYLLEQYSGPMLPIRSDILKSCPAETALSKYDYQIQAYKPAIPELKKAAETAEENR